MYQINYHDGRIIDGFEELEDAKTEADNYALETYQDIDIEEYEPYVEDSTKIVATRTWIDDAFDDELYDDEDPICMENGFYCDWE